VEEGEEDKNSFLFDELMSFTKTLIAEINMSHFYQPRHFYSKRCELKQITENMSNSSTNYKLINSFMK
jgi:hypothetical protein